MAKQSTVFYLLIQFNPIKVLIKCLYKIENENIKKIMRSRTKFNSELLYYMLQKIGRVVLEQYKRPDKKKGRFEKMNMQFKNCFIRD